MTEPIFVSHSRLVTAMGNSQWGGNPPVGYIRFAKITVALITGVLAYSEYFAVGGSFVVGCAIAGVFANIIDSAWQDFRSTSGYGGLLSGAMIKEYVFVGLFAAIGGFIGTMYQQNPVLLGSFGAGAGAWIGLYFHDTMM